MVDSISNFLYDNFKIKYAPDVDTSLIALDKGEIIATGSRKSNVFKYFGVKEEYKGNNISTKLIDKLREDAFNEGIYHYFIFTSKDMVKLFEATGFSLIYKGEWAALLEAGSVNINDYIKDLKEGLNLRGEDVGSIVMNLNPMTLGHLHLINEAKKACDELLVFIVEEDKSIFPFKDRFEIGKKEIEKIPGVRLIRGGPYIISRATFPSYFLKKVDDDILAYTNLDAGIFLNYYCHKLNIKKRFLGEEPLDELTSIYNKTLKDKLEKGGVDVVIFPRLSLNGEVISASKVRNLIKEDRLKEAKNFLTESSRAYLDSKEGQEVIKKIKDN